MNPVKGSDEVDRGIRFDCPAKINLELRVGSRRGDWGGRHLLNTIYSAIGIYDTISLARREPGSGFALALDGDHLGDLDDKNNAEPQSNLAVKALLSLARVSGHQPDISIHIIKRIPVGAGLAGGSTDAAGVLLGLNQIWKLNWPLSSLEKLAAGLGADIPFCLHGGICRGTDFGQTLQLLGPEGKTVHDLSRQGLTGHLVIGAYQDELSTRQVYEAFDQIGPGSGDLNDLQLTACTLHPRSLQALDIASRFGIGPSFVSGSGPSVVVMVPTRNRVQDLREAWIEAGAVDWVLEADSPVRPSFRSPSVTH